MSIPLFEIQVTMMTAFPGTPLYERLLNAGRIIEPGRWDLCTLFDVNFQPAKMTIQELQKGMFWLVKKLYSDECVAARRRPFLERLWQRERR
jgi:radical SAM superfamily enzyme YgiQ (UPF0313 family)